jgi:hypothetical protein
LLYQPAQARGAGRMKERLSIEESLKQLYCLSKKWQDCDDESLVTRKSAYFNCAAQMELILYFGYTEEEASAIRAKLNEEDSLEMAREINRKAINQ